MVRAVVGSLVARAGSGYPDSPVADQRSVRSVCRSGVGSSDGQAQGTSRVGQTHLPVPGDGANQLRKHHNRGFPRGQAR
jgi:hypothetical protein